MAALGAYKSKLDCERLAEMLRSAMKDLHISTYALEKSSLKAQIEASFVLFEVIDTASLATTIKVQENRRELTLETNTRLCHIDRTPFCLEHHHMIRLMSRYFLKLNGSFRFGFFTIDGDTGNISYRVNSNHKLVRGSYDENHLKNMLKISITTAYFALKFHIYKVLFMINAISHKDLPKVVEASNRNASNPSSYRKVNSEVLRHIDNLKNYTKKASVENNYWSSEQKASLLYSQSNDAGASKILIVTPIHIKQLYEKRSNVTSGGFGDLSLLKVKYHPQGQEKKEISRYIFMKEQRERKASQPDQQLPSWHLSDESLEEEQRMDNEYHVLEHLENRKSECQNVAKFFSATALNKKEHAIPEKAILMEYYPHKSLEHFRQRHEHMSLNTKVWFLIQIANGLRYLNQEGVYHLDVKYVNTLVQKNYVLRLIDFGESFLSNPDPGVTIPRNKYLANFKPGRTLPYASPELVRKPFRIEDLNTRTDVFSFGILMGEFLFERFLVDFKKSNLYSLQTKYKNSSYKTHFTKEEAKLLGPESLYKRLRKVALACIHPDAEQRPTFEWLVIMLKEAMHYLEKMY